MSGHSWAALAEAAPGYLEVLGSPAWALVLAVAGLVVVRRVGQPGTARARALLTGGTGQEPPEAWRRALARLRAGWRPEWWCPPGAAAVALLAGSFVPLVLALPAWPVVRRVRRTRAEARARAARADAVVVLCGLLAGEVRAGSGPAEALAHAVNACGELGPARADILAAARFGGDVPAALRQAARVPGAEGLVGLAACWRVALDRGAGLAVGLERLERALLADRDQRADLLAQLSGARATAGLLAALPLLGLLLGSAVGAAPLRVLFGSAPGFVCLVIGSGLEAAGVWWCLWLVRQAQRGAGVAR
ncbi:MULTISPECIES: type II secretion system F family protein [Streptomyces]|uniref:Type II secretion system F family protein n=3 Tax=Streptomyces TaxID=1883 RepID=A0ABU2RAL3_9ACTN|nr:MULTISPECIES: type II secretion system F family protein [unclassified Streptomyces]MDT0413149.1 type II secretion system F family protein [Streptomyces sp. DSM 41979]